MACLLLLIVWLVPVMLTGLTRCACLAALVLLVMKTTLFLSLLPTLLCGSRMRTLYQGRLNEKPVASIRFYHVVPGFGSRRLVRGRGINP